MAYLGGTHGTVTSPSPSPRVGTKLDPSKKMYSLGCDLYSVYHHKQYRVTCQLGTGFLQQHFDDRFILFKT